ncbi:MAG: ABC transporter substrate-binding protein [Thermodesulfobacteriota bacterium]
MKRDPNPCTLRTLLLSGMLAAAVFFPDAVVAGESGEPAPGWMEWGEKYWPAKPVGGGILRVAAPYFIGVMNPNHFPVMDWVTMSYIYEKLVIHDAAYKPVNPWLAESWSFLDDRTVLMRLRKGVRFHDGAEFTAEGLKYQMEWIMDATNGAWSRTWLEPLDFVEVVDSHTVKWHFKQPWGAFLGTMASVPGYMISPKALKADRDLAELRRLRRGIAGLERDAETALEDWENVPEEDAAARIAARGKTDAADKVLADARRRIRKLERSTRKAKSLDYYPVGSGQYMLEKSSPGNYTRLKRNPDWWFGQSIGRPEMPYFEGVTVSVIPDPSVRLAGLKAGSLDYIVVNPFQHRLVEADPRLRSGIAPLNWLVWLMLNQSKGPLKDIRVRKAISHAIDRKALIMGTQSGLGREASCIFPDNHWAHNPDLQPAAYDPELSRRLLAEAGYPDGLTLTGFTSNEPVSQAFAKAVMAMLEKVNIKWDCKLLGIAAMAEPFMRRKYDMAGGLYQWIFEPDHIASTLYLPEGILNCGRNRNEKVVALIMQGRREIDESSRKRIYQQLERELYENYEDIWLWYPMSVIGANAKIQGFNIDMLRAYGEGYVWSHPNWFENGAP